MVNEQKNLAEKLAQLIQENKSADAAFLRASLEKINQRLDKIEAQLNPQNQTQTPQSSHPSQERFPTLEEIADEIIKNMPNEKACPYEPTGKPCDHCAMCSSRGF